MLGLTKVVWLHKGMAGDDAVRASVLLLQSVWNHVLTHIHIVCIDVQASWRCCAALPPNGMLRGTQWGVA